MHNHPILTGFSLVVLFSFLYLWGLGDKPFYTKGEAREAIVVWEIVHTGEWVLPLRNGQIVPSKPPLFHWCGALLSLAWGEVTELTVRLPSALLGIVGVLLTYATGVLLWGVGAGVIAAVILGTSLEWLRAAVTARVDMTLTVCMMAAFLFFFVLYRRQQVSRAAGVLFFTFLGLGTLAKGPVGTLLPVLTIGIFLAIRHELLFLKRLPLLSGGIVLVLIAGSWYALAIWQGGEAFFAKQIMEENVLRFFASGEAGTGHEHPFYYFVPYLFLGMVPWSFFLPPLAVFLYQRRHAWADQGFVYLLVWVATIFFFYSASSSKRSVYILPLYPAVALLLGAWWQELRQGSVGLPPRLFWLLRGCGYVAVGLILLTMTIVAAQYFGYNPFALIRPLLHPKDQANVPLFTGIIDARPTAFILWICIVVPAATLLAVSLRRQRWDGIFAALAGFTISTFLLINLVFQSAVAAARTYRPFMNEISKQVGHQPLFFYHYYTFDNGAVFYGGRHIPLYEHGDRPLDRSCFLLMWERDWTDMAARDTHGLQAMAVSDGTGPKGRNRLVLVYVPAGVAVPPPPDRYAIPEDADFLMDDE